MPPVRKSTPSDVLPDQSDRGRLAWYDATGARQQRLLPGPFSCAESLAAKARLELEIGSSTPGAVARDVITVNELLLAYASHAETHYRHPDGTSTGEIEHVKTVSRVVRELYGKVRSRISARSRSRP
jgi:hypothetical protein